MIDINDIYVNEKTENILPSKTTNNNSWADIVDVEISPNIENKLLISSSCDSSSNDPKGTSKGLGGTKQITSTYNIADIISTHPETIDVITLLEWQTYLSSHLKKYIKQCSELAEYKLDYNLHISKFEWLAKVSKLLSDKAGLKITCHKTNNYDIQHGIIPRSSYKFCEYNYDCQYNYREEKYNGCYAQHFVHNLVYADISSVIYYLKYIHESNKNYNYDELVKCITTVAYVIKHMYEELSNLQFHYGNIYVDKIKTTTNTGTKKTEHRRTNFRKRKQ